MFLGVSVSKKTS
ncbi:Protein CBG25858 [Caenorhabditis briggsae]|uniref:Protein CBG25858 n=1 Tax=Caenorhabditis briggsae TaxID=6238 RepID=B6IIT5_CAEBR|nr:Protein CBG25858 [Caenorhabditis briggsae]CAR99815.1 Protein CBG25858 [Caenorhabditis briggsae]